jgi:hypothetical protein
MSFYNLVKLSQIKNFSLPDYAHVNKMTKKKTINIIRHDDIGRAKPK